MLRVTGFGQSGPYASRRAFGTLAEAMSGFAHQTGEPNGPPTLPPFGLADGVAGITGAFAVVSALYDRDSPGGDGQAKSIDLSLLEPLVGILGPGPSVLDQLGVIAGRHGNRSPNNAPRNTYLTQRRPLGGDLGQRDIGRRTGDAAGGTPRHGRAAMVCLGGRTQPKRDLLDDAVAKWIADPRLRRSERAIPVEWAPRWRPSTTSNS